MNEKILVVNTASVEKVTRAIEAISHKLFEKPIITVLCTDAFADAFRQNPSVSSVDVYNPGEGFKEIIRLLIKMRKRRYDVATVLYCLDTKRYVMKSLPFLFGAKKVLIFNENLDCAYATLKFLYLFLRARLRDGTLITGLPACQLASLPAKLIFFPFVFLYLLLNTGLMTLRRYSKVKNKK
ncbi:MAG TPA: hypothetical protein ACFYD6_08860 [Candidatus Brocadiia bacterium]|nr:hypothetical protein [Candidatus Brocadiales bacterium]